MKGKGDLPINIDVTSKDNIYVGMLVEIVADENKVTQEVTRGYIKEVLSKKDNKKGIRVKLTNGKTGKIVYIPSKNEIKTENFKFYNLFFFKDKIYSIWDKETNKYLILRRINKSNGKIENTALLFSERSIADRLIKGTTLDNNNLIIREINRKKYIIENFKTLDVKYFSINGERKLSFKKMKEWEEYFKNMR